MRSVKTEMECSNLILCCGNEMCIMATFVGKYQCKFVDFIGLRLKNFHQVVSTFIRKTFTVLRYIVANVTYSAEAKAKAKDSYNYSESYRKT